MPSSYFNNFFFQANISLEEYSLMYGVYQKSVRQTEAITNLQKLVQISDSTNSHDFAHTVSPKSKYIYIVPIHREDARGVAGVATATPKFQVLLYKLVLKWISKKFLYTAGYPNLKFLTSSLRKRANI